MNKDTNSRAASAPELADLAAEIDSLLSVADLAKLLGKSEQSVRNMRFKGILPEPRRIPGFGLRWAPEQIRSYLESLNPAQWPLLGTPSAVNAALTIGGTTTGDTAEVSKYFQDRPEAVGYRCGASGAG